MMMDIKLSKWIVLLFCCLLSFGSYYSFDTPSALHNQMRFYYHEYYNEIEFEYYFSLIYSLYSLPNTILPLIGGKLVDIYGNNFILLLFSSFIFIGSIVETLGCMNTNLIIVVLGRFIFGLGAETVSVCVSIFISKWFRGEELAFALAFQLSMAKLASVLTDWISPELHRIVGLRWTSALTTFICMASFVSACWLITLDQRHDQDIVHQQEYNELPPMNNNIDDDVNGEVELHTIEGNDDEDTNLLAYYQLNSMDISSSVATTSSASSSSAAAIPITGPTTKTTSTDFELQSSSSSSSTSSNIDSESIFTSLYMLPTILWLVLAVDFMMYGTFIPFTSWSNPILLQFYFTPTDGTSTTSTNSPTSFSIADSNLIANTGMQKGSMYSDTIEDDQIRAAWLQSIPYVLVVLLTPLLGFTVDIFGYRTQLLMLAALFLSTAHGLIYVCHHYIGPVMPLVLIGLAYSVFGSVIWPCVPVIVSEKMQGLGYGLMTSCQNTGQFIVPIILAHVYEWNKSYIDCESVFIITSIISLVLSIILIIYDEFYNKALLRKICTNWSKNESIPLNDSYDSGEYIL